LQSLGFVIKAASDRSVGHIEYL